MPARDPHRPLRSDAESDQPEPDEEFELRVYLAGICLHVFGDDHKKLTTVLPDARLPDAAALNAMRDPTRKPKPHLDLTDAEPHAGYLRFDLRNVPNAGTGMLELDPPSEVSYEVVHRFEREQLDLGLTNSGEKIGGTVKVPHLEGFAPILEPDPAIFIPKPDERVLMRTELLNGYATVTDTDPVKWRIAGHLNPDGKDLVGDFGGEILWTRKLPGRKLTLRLVSFDDPAKVTEIPLEAIRDVNKTLAITLKIANLCKVNPLEWPQLSSRDAGVPDVDFKWLYRLLRMKTGSETTPFLHKPMPIPIPERVPAPNEGSLQNCLPLAASV